MGAVGRILLIVVVIVLGLGALGYFLGPKTASRSQTLEIAAPAPTVLARLASTPVGATVVEGVTVAEPATVEGDTVTAPVTYADGATGRVSYRVTPSEDGSRVEFKLEQNLGANPLDRFQVITGGAVAPLIANAATAVQTDLNALPDASFEGLQYSVVDITARPFFYAQSCVPNEPDTITTLIADAKTAIEPLMRSRGLQQAGPLMAVEPRVVENQYCFQIGYPFTGRAPGSVLGTLIQTGQTPGGQALRVVYTGSEEDVYEQVYDPMDALLGAARLDDPSTREDDWVTYEVYHDDPTQAGGSRNREIFYVAQGDISALTRIQAPVEAAAVPANAPAEAPATTTTPPATTTPAPTP
ncbi:MAG: hypothetical protein AB7H66_13145 [Hyphomonadaceae bacterium]